MCKTHLIKRKAGFGLTFASTLVLACLACAGSASASAFNFILQPGVAWPLKEPQSKIYNTGGKVTAKGLFGITKWMDFGLSTSFTAFPGKERLPSYTLTQEAGNEQVIRNPKFFSSAWDMGLSLRFKTVREIATYSVSPWLDVDALMSRREGINRPAWSGAVGLSFPLNESRTIFFGPFVRYTEVFHYGKQNPMKDHLDTRMMTAGLTLEFATGRTMAKANTVVKKEIVCPDRDGDSVPDTIDKCPDVKGVIENAGCPVTPTPVPTPAPTPCADRDKDGVPDMVDNCPDVPGPRESFGCPVYEKVTFTRERMELKEKIQFKVNSAVILPVSYDLLNEAAKALNDNNSLHVQIEGHASSEGTFEHNQMLSENRARAIMEYLIDRGVVKDRLTFKGYSSSRPIADNKTQAGREMNRRVEFIIRFLPTEVTQ